MIRLLDKSWEKIFGDYNIFQHNFNEKPFSITADQIKKACQDFTESGAKDISLLCKHESREKRPSLFIERNLFLLPIRKGVYTIIKGEGYIDLPKIKENFLEYESKLDFHLDTLTDRNSHIHHIDFTFATSLIRTFIEDDSLELTLRGRKCTPQFNFIICNQEIVVDGVQIEIIGGYEGKKQFVFIEGVNPKLNNIEIKRIFYPYRFWQNFSKKKVSVLIFKRDEEDYSIWQFELNNPMDYNRVELLKSQKFKIFENIFK